MIESKLAAAFEEHGFLTVQCFARRTWWDKLLLRKDGKLKWWVATRNIMPNVALNDVLNVYFAASAQTTAFYMGMIDNAGFSATAPGDTMAVHAGWVENQQCSNTGRPQWIPGTSTIQTISNPAQVVFNMNPPSGCSIRGFFLSSNNTLGGTSGTLSATATLSVPQACNNGDTLKVTFAINATTS